MRRFVAATLVWAAIAAPALAQQPAPLPTFVIDARGFKSSLGQDATSAAALGIPSSDMPSGSLGGTIGATIYPFHGTGGQALGFGAEGILGRARSSVVDPTGATPPFPVETRLAGFSASVSLNFGHRDGWSYISAGAGPLQIESFTGGVLPTTATPSRVTPNAGAGALWFSSRRVAFCFDLRFYSTQQIATANGYAGRDRKTLLVLSAGLTFR